MAFWAGLGVVGDDLLDFGYGQFARGFKVFRALRCEVLHAFDFDCAGGGGQYAVAVDGMGDAAGVPQLRENQPAFGVDGGSYLFPCANLRLGEQTWGERAA